MQAEFEPKISGWRDPDRVRVIWVSGSGRVPNSSRNHPWSEGPRPSSSHVGESRPDTSQKKVKLRKERGGKVRGAGRMRAENHPGESHAAEFELRVGGAEAKYMSQSCAACAGAG